MLIHSMHLDSNHKLFRIFYADTANSFHYSHVAESQVLAETTGVRLTCQDW